MLCWFTIEWKCIEKWGPLLPFVLNKKMIIKLLIMFLWVGLWSLSTKYGSLNFLTKITRPFVIGLIGILKFEVEKKPLLQLFQRT